MGHKYLNDDWREGRSRGWDELIDHSSGNKGCIVGSVLKHGRLDLSVPRRLAGVQSRVIMTR